MNHNNKQQHALILEFDGHTYNQARCSCGSWYIKLAEAPSTIRDAHLLVDRDYQSHVMTGATGAKPTDTLAWAADKMAESQADRGILHVLRRLSRKGLLEDALTLAERLSKAGML